MVVAMVWMLAEDSYLLVCLCVYLSENGNTAREKKRQDDMHVCMSALYTCTHMATIRTPFSHSSILYSLPPSHTHVHASILCMRAYTNAAALIRHSAHR